MMNDLGLSKWYMFDERFHILSSEFAVFVYREPLHLVLVWQFNSESSHALAKHETKAHQTK